MADVPYCLFRVGNRVTINPASLVYGDWQGEFVITGIHWEYQRSGGINITLASDSEIEHKDGDTDGWSPDDLILAGKSDG